MPKDTPTKKKALNGRNGARKRTVRPYAARAREYEDLMVKVGLNQLECSELFEFSTRASRRYRRGEGRMPVAALKLLRLIARGVLTKRQVAQA